ncbi:hypothetical protein [Streptomyces sp. SLBN-115]|uniref:hypothetical protein n=1 Tax=Streptomyces sp. SLBN-115 TaxID=2768453 RepID=UPI001150EBAD|nr:hypothetical protein [Streptomyces sp. SLBN-115]TQJ37089.1 hypothetical protein FBY34_8595 [Streptomyces sp. SLBN-115]
MSENTTELTSQYTAQVSADLERNAKEQERIGAEIVALQEQLAAHQRDHAVLVGIQQAIAAAPAAAEPSVLPDSAAVPAPRAAKKQAEPSAGKARPKNTAPAPRRSAAGKPAAKKASTKSGKAEPATTAQPTLVDLVRGHLTEQSEPRSAAEIAAALGQAHPDRSVKTTVVRTTLEGLVAKSQAQRSKQGSSVFYTAAAVPERAAEQPAAAGA